MILPLAPSEEWIESNGLYTPPLGMDLKLADVTIEVTFTVEHPVAVHKGPWTHISGRVSYIGFLTALTGSVGDGQIDVSIQLDRELSSRGTFASPGLLSTGGKDPSTAANGIFLGS